MSSEDAVEISVTSNTYTIQICQSHAKWRQYDTEKDRLCA